MNLLGSPKESFLTEIEILHKDLDTRVAELQRKEQEIDKLRSHMQRMQSDIAAIDGLRREIKRLSWAMSSKEEEQHITAKQHHAEIQVCCFTRWEISI